MNLLRKKSITKLILESQQKSGLKKALGALDLTALGIGAIIGTGIFVLTGVAAAEYAGPALVLSFVISGIACAFAALVYAEFASMVPVAGSAYTYSYAALGEFFAWIIGWDLMLEYALACSTVAIGWSGYFVKLLQGLGINLPAWGTLSAGSGGLVNIPALLIALLITWLLSQGVKESTRVNNIIVAIKLFAVLVFIVVSIFYVKPANWQPFMPYGWNGVFRGAAIVFFAYIGFDAVSTAAEEVKNPQKDLPRGIIASLIVCTVLYIIVTALLTGAVSYTKLNVSAPIALALQVMHQNWAAGIISIGALGGITTVLLVMLYGQTRVFYAMSRDGLLPKIFSETHPIHKTPNKSTWLTGIIVAIVAGLTPIDVLAEMVNIGTMSAFVFVSIAVIVLRKSQPDLPRAFRCPGVPVVPLLAAAFSLFLMFKLPGATWIRFFVWLVIGLAIYFLYGYKHSNLNREAKVDVD
ncbi:putative amino acid permease YhdG [Desulfosporosinus acididurans]|uniref:Putative amino acid permease YhdG n=1 Tax=Desulfosporosinus acididurans TaxID=476652 RepID=A0A0J1ISL8_9FIRM|nr:amino acid permease [Desulfosporosinus acididurans]KLU67651.1 putative amino acid permease YhdG [Desulfosporosinus acididurans]